MSRALKETVEHLVEFKTQALNADKQSLEHKHEDVAENDDNPKAYGIFSEHICKGEENAHHSGVNKHEGADSEEGIIRRGRVGRESESIAFAARRMAPA